VGGNSITLQGASGSTTSSFRLEVHANRVNNLFGVSFDLIYPAAILDWVPGGTVEGSFLDGGGSVPTELLVSESVDGTLVVGHSRLGNLAGAEGEGLLFSLEFTPRASGSGSFEFESETAYNAQAGVKDGVEWRAGSIQITL
jgi:hypothetical protein